MICAVSRKRGDEGFKIHRKKRLMRPYSYLLSVVSLQLCYRMIDASLVCHEGTKLRRLAWCLRLFVANLLLHHCAIKMFHFETFTNQGQPLIVILKSEIYNVFVPLGLW